jgi:hypothetical protein
MTATKTVTVVCACGASFQREVKRGRPQVWCPTCLAVPFYERARVEAPAVTVEPADEQTPAPQSEWDDLAHAREDIETKIQAIYDGHRERFAQLVAAGMSPMDAGEKAHRKTFLEITEVYAQYRPNRTPMVGSDDDD